MNIIHNLYFQLSTWVLAWISGLCFVPAANWALPRIRKFVYARGFRPTGPFLHSPSLHLQYTFKDATSAFQKGADAAKNKPSVTLLLPNQEPELSMKDKIVQELLNAGVSANDLAHEMNPVYEYTLERLYNVEIRGRLLAAFWYLLCSDEMGAQDKVYLQTQNLERGSRQIHKLINEVRE
jgi:hypothetical protein